MSPIISALPSKTLVIREADSLLEQLELSRILAESCRLYYNGPNKNGKTRSMLWRNLYENQWPEQERS